MLTYLAQRLKIGGQEIQGPLKLRGPTGDVIQDPTLADLVNVFVSFLYPIAGIILFFVLVWGGFDLLTSRGTPEKVESGKHKITSGIIGFALLFISFLAVRLIAFIFGLGEGIF
ncbi:MAG: hypothetical protein ACE5DQ_00710 [Candidatus Paceibacterota bacterium]